MSTSCTILFQAENALTARVYRHYDGDPDSVSADMERFFDAVEEQCIDTRFADPPYLAAKFVVWQAWEYAKSHAAMTAAIMNGKARPDAVAPLAFNTVGICTRDADDLAYVHTVTCSGGRPVLTSRRAR